MRSVATFIFAFYNILRLHVFLLFLNFTIILQHNNVLAWNLRPHYYHAPCPLFELQPVGG